MDEAYRPTMDLQFYSLWYILRMAAAEPDTDAPTLHHLAIHISDEENE